MAIIYNSLKNVWNNLLNESKTNISFLPLVLLMVSIPLKLGINNVFLVVFVVSILMNKNKSKLSFSLVLMLPILLFLWMGLSYFWSIDPSRTINAIPKEIALLIIPLSFSIFLISKSQKQTSIRIYSFAMVFFVVYYLVRAIIKYAITQDSRVFFYHGENEDDYGLVPKLLNAIHFSVFVAIAFFYFFTQEVKTKLNIGLSLLLFVFIVLLSSKNNCVLRILAV